MGAARPSEAMGVSGRPGFGDAMEVDATDGLAPGVHIARLHAGSGRNAILLFAGRSACFETEVGSAKGFVR